MRGVSLQMELKATGEKSFLYGNMLILSSCHDAQSFFQRLQHCSSTQSQFFVDNMASGEHRDKGISYTVKGQDKLLFSAILVFTQCLDTSCVAQTRKVLDKNICATFVAFS